MFVTFYDVSKAYDWADVNDMLVTVWERGLRGKLWRLMKNLNTEGKSYLGLDVPGRR